MTRKKMKNDSFKKRIWVLLLTIAFLIPIVSNHEQSGHVMAQSTPNDSLSVYATGNYWVSGPSAYFPQIRWDLTLVGTTVTVSSTANVNFTSDYNLTFGSVNLGVSRLGVNIGSCSGSFSATGPITLTQTTFTVPAGTVIDDLDFGYQASFTLYFPSKSYSRTFSYSDNYASGLENYKTVLSGNEYYEVQYHRSCPVAASFTASPTTVAPGQPVTLQWDVSYRYKNKVRIFNTTGNTLVGEFALSSGQTTVNPTTTTSYQLQIVDISGNPVSCFSPLNVTVQINSAPQFFWIVKRLPIEGKVYPPGSPPFYVEPPFGTPAPGTNDPNSFRRVPTTGTFTAPSFEAALTLQPYLKDKNLTLIQLRSGDVGLPGGLRSPNYLAANGDYTVAFYNLYPNAVANYDAQTPGYAGPKQGTSAPKNLASPKWNERVDPYDN